jgi:ABC-type amino acid transport substrate-binding protein
MQKKFLSLAIAVLIISLTTGCATIDESKSIEVEKVDILRVGITPDFPPLIYKRGDEVVGVEADLARELAARLNRGVQFVDLSWKDEIPALLRAEIDIVMAGMSMTETREIRIRFSDHYMKSGLVAMMRAEDRPRFNSLEVITESLPNVGVVTGTTSEIFVRRNFPKATNVVALQESDHAPSALGRRAIDIFVYDAPAILWLVSENEAELSGFWEPFNEEELAWAVRRDDEEFLKQVNVILKDMRRDGTLDKILNKWLPSDYLERFR